MTEDWVKNIKIVQNLWTLKETEINGVDVLMTVRKHRVRQQVGNLNSNSCAHQFWRTKKDRLIV